MNIGGVCKEHVEEGWGLQATGISGKLPKKARHTRLRDVEKRKRGGCNYIKSQNIIL